MSPHDADDLAANVHLTLIDNDYSADDRVLLRLRFESGMRVAAIARAWQCGQQLLYRRIDTLVRRLRQQLVSAGIDAVTAAQLIGDEQSRLEFGWGDEKRRRSRPSR